MKLKEEKILEEVRESIKVIIDMQLQLMKDISDLREEQIKLQEEVRFNNFVLNNMAMRSEIIN